MKVLLLHRYIVFALCVGYYDKKGVGVIVYSKITGFKLIEYDVIIRFIVQIKGYLYTTVCLMCVQKNEECIVWWYVSSVDRYRNICSCILYKELWLTWHIFKVLRPFEIIAVIVVERESSLNVIFGAQANLTCTMILLARRNLAQACPNRWGIRRQSLP